MRALRILLAVAGVSTLAFAGACSRTEDAPGVLMLAIQTDLAVGKTQDIQAVGLYVRDLDRGRTLFQLTEPVAPDGTVKFPATLAIVGRNNPGASVRIRIVGFRSGEAQVMREAVTTIPRDRVALLSLPLRWVNYGKSTGKMPPGGAGPSLAPLAEGEADDPASDPFGLVFNVDPNCKGETTYIDGACASWAIDSDKLPEFVEADVFGGGTASGGGACFDTEKCFATSTPIAFDASTCLAPRPPGEFTLGVKLPPGSSGGCVGDGCFIPLDPEHDEGWRSDPSGAIKISPGTCERVRNGRFQIVATSACGSKAALAPLCGAASTVGPGTDLPTSNDGGLDGGLDAGDASDGRVETLPDGAPIVPETLAAAATPTALALDGNTLYYTTIDAKLWRLVANGPANQSPVLVKDFTIDAGIQQPDVRIAAAGGRVLVGVEDRLYTADSSGASTYVMSSYPPRVARGVALTATASFYAHGSGGSSGGGVFRCPAAGCVAIVSAEQTVQQYYDGTVRELAYDPQSNALFTNIQDNASCAGGSGVCLMRMAPTGSTSDPLTPVALLPALGVTNISVDPAQFGNVYFTVGHDELKVPGGNDTIVVVSKTANSGTALTFVTDQLTARLPGDVRIQHQLANDSKFLFWTSSPGGVLAKSITAPAASTQTTTISSEPGARAIAVDATYVYWTTAVANGAVRRMARAGVAFK